MKNIDIIKYKKVKENRLKGIDKKNSMLEAGYSYNTASSHQGDMSVVKRCDDEIMQELKAKEVSVDMVLSRLNEDRNLAKVKGDIATMAKVDELLGKFLAMFTEKKEVSAVIISNEERNILNKYIIDAKINIVKENLIDNQNPENTNSGVGVG